MRYAIAYISNRSPSVSDKDVDLVLSQADQFNNQNDITGLLVYSDENFFQLIEGEKDKVIQLYKKISKDTRHRNVIKFLEREISNSSYDGYYCDEVNDKFEVDESKFHDYRNYLRVLDEPQREALLEVLKTIFPNSPIHLI